MTRSTPNAFASTIELARFAMKRHLRSRRTIIALVALGLVVVAVGYSRSKGDQTATDAWSSSLQTGLLSFACYVVPFLFHASSFSEEHEDRTLTYLLVRPVSRTSIVLGKYLAGTALVLAANLATTLALFGASYVGAFELAEASQLARGLAAVALLSIGHSAIAAMWSAIMPEQATPVTVMHFAILELGVHKLPSLFPLITMHHHASVLSGDTSASQSSFGPTPVLPLAASVGVILALTVFYLALAAVVASGREYRFAKA